MYNIYTAAGLLWHDGLAQSPSEAVPFNLQEGPLGGGFPEKPLPFECYVRWAFLLGLSWCFKLSL